MIKASWIKPGAIVIDVGIQRPADADGKTRLVGDVATPGGRPRWPARSRPCQVASAR